VFLGWCYFFEFKLPFQLYISVILRMPLFLLYVVYYLKVRESDPVACIEVAKRLRFAFPSNTRQQMSSCFHPRNTKSSIFKKVVIFRTRRKNNFRNPCKSKLVFSIKDVL